MNTYFALAVLLAVVLAAGAGTFAFTGAANGSAPVDLSGGSKWTVDTGKGGTENWYFATAADGSLQMHFETSVDEGSTTVQEFHGGKEYKYKRMNTGAWAAKAKADGATMPATGASKSECVVSAAAVTAGGSVKVDGNTWSLSGLSVTFSDAGVPTKISTQDGDFAITAVEANAADGMFDGCTVEGAAAGRDLGVREELSGFWNYAAGNYEWCGPGTDTCGARCPGYTGRPSSTVHNDRCCRRHDFGDKWSEHGWYNVLECKVDRDLGSCVNDNTIGGIYVGQYGLTMGFGCYNWRSEQNCWWHWNSRVSCGWRGCSGGWQRRCSSSTGWHRDYGPWRYKGLGYGPRSQRGGYMAKTKDSYGTDCSASTVTGENRAASCGGTRRICGEGKNTATGVCPGDVF